jgi:hypothetical protein
MTPSEQVAKDCLVAEGWSVLHNGWPDFLCFRQGQSSRPDVIAVEVKLPPDRPTEKQKQLHHILIAAGIPVYMLHDVRGMTARQQRRMVPAQPVTGAPDECQHCGHHWFRKNGRRPRQCPSCWTRDWEKKAKK